MSYIPEIPYGAYWSTPFTKWQGSLAHCHSIELAAHVAKLELEKRNILPADFDHGVLGTTVPQKSVFYGTPWLMSMLGANQATGPMIGQACATGIRSVSNAVQEISAGLATCSLVVTADRCSNGAHLYYPNPTAPGGTGDHEDWVMDNFNCDPVGRHAMINTAENVAKKHDISTTQQHDVVLMRQEQYAMALSKDHAFQKRYMTLPFDIPTANFKKTRGQLSRDEGVVQSSAEGLQKLRPVLPEGTVTFGGQTHPADGNAGMIVTTPEKAREMSSDNNVRIRLLGFGSARVELAHMPEATVPAAKQALAQAGVAIKEIDAVKSHNPFAVNDILFSKQTGVALEQMNNYGCSLIWGHPQGPTALRSLIELIEELTLRGGGKGLFQGCAAGDSAMAVVVSVEVSD
ncbi:thiolase family protein [Pseudomaricurvus alkylphenolicus]|uniref:thiolase family protein n=1 Tax=Pseudomaricurvus alkylphenolicus TaxID=1306991 RepID=UPI00141D7CBC|nr:thiolase family protein [Pseudomaricurvus alkylphenolicus]NIB43459.1 thiolase family protein [Pseudomaricurvus alkylphenolicus]